MTPSDANAYRVKDMIVGGGASVGKTNLFNNSEQTCLPWRRITHSVKKSKQGL